MTRASHDRALVESLESRLFLSVVPAAPPAHVSDGLHAVGKTVYFVGTNAKSGTELWKTDGSRARTSIVKDILPGKLSSEPQSLVTARNKLFFVASDKRGRAIWSTRGTAATTTRLSSGDYQNATAVGDQLYFIRRSSNGISSLWRSDGTPAGTRRIRARVPSEAVLFGGDRTLYLMVEGLVLGQPKFSIYASDGTPRGMKLVATGEPSRWYHEGWGLGVTGALYVTLGDRLLFVPKSAGPAQLWSCDTTGARPVGPAPIGQPAKAGKRLYYVAAGAAGDELWVTNGTAEGTRKIGGLPRPSTPFYQGPIPAGAPSLHMADGWLFAEYSYHLSGEPFADELWRINPVTAQMARIGEYVAMTGRDDDFTTATARNFHPINTGLVFNHLVDIDRNMEMLFASGDTLTAGAVPTKFGSIGFTQPLDVSGQLFFLQAGGNEFSKLYVWNYSDNKAPRRV